MKKHRDDLVNATSSRNRLPRNCKSPEVPRMSGLGPDSIINLNKTNVYSTIIVNNYGVRSEERIKSPTVEDIEPLLNKKHKRKLLATLEKSNIAESKDLTETEHNASTSSVERAKTIYSNRAIKHKKRDGKNTPNILHKKKTKLAKIIMEEQLDDVESLKPIKKVSKVTKRQSTMPINHNFLSCSNAKMTESSTSQDES